MEEAWITKTQLLGYEAKLQQLAADLEKLLKLSSAADGAVELDQSRQGRLSRMDAMQGHAMAQAAVVRQRTQLAGARSALQRIKNNQFGRCLECHEWIAQARLEFDLATAHCLVCASALEGQ